MSSRERVRAALAHQTPDALPIDLGSTAVTGVHVSCVAALRDYYGLERRPVKVTEPYQMLGELAEHLKERYGRDLVFWGGGVDTQKTLPFGTPGQVREEVLRRCEIFGQNGGYVFNAIHNVQARTPVENIVAAIDAVHEFNGDG